jgi:hypothetical protein
MKMIDIERLKVSASEGKSMAEAARDLGVSRARVHQIATRDGIEFRNGRHGAQPRINPPASRSSPNPRIKTGGPHVLLTPSMAGKVVEMIVVADLLARGWQVFLPIFSNRGHDLVAYAAGNLITVEVRSAHRDNGGKLAYAKRPSDKSMHYALVVSGEVVHYEPEIASGWNGMPDEQR